jgi:hypothetical protein
VISLVSANEKSAIFLMIHHFAVPCTILKGSLKPSHQSDDGLDLAMIETFLTHNCFDNYSQVSIIAMSTLSWL